MMTLNQVKEHADACTERTIAHAQKMLSDEDFVLYMMVMKDLTQLVRDLSMIGKKPVWNECLASLNEIMKSGEEVTREDS